MNGLFLPMNGLMARLKNSASPNPSKWRGERTGIQGFILVL